MSDPQAVLLPDPLLEQARSALERQSFALMGVQRRVEEAGAQLPSVSGTGWTGPARDVYELGLDELARAVDRARGSVRAALVETDIALDSLARQGG